MEWMDGIRRWGGMLWVGGGIAFETANLIHGETSWGAVTVVIMAGVCVLAAAILLDATARFVWLAGWVAAVLLGVDFLGAVADRFGAFGPPGTEGVSWGSWDAFVDYTARLLPDMSRGMVTVAAVGATAAECAVGLLLISGIHRRWVGKASAGLLLFYLIAMGVSVGVGEVADYALPIFIGGSLLVSSVPARRTDAARSDDDREPAMSRPT